MRLSEINIRDPFVLVEKGKYYLYGTRAANFGIHTGGFDVYVSEDLETWSDSMECFNSRKYGLDREVNWAPEVHKYGEAFYMFATFTKENGLRGVYILKSDDPTGPFVPYSEGAVTPDDWECLDGTLYVSESGEPYLVFCHEHTQIIDGTVCYFKLSKDIKCAQGEPICLFHGSTPEWADRNPEDGHYVTDGPFLFTTDSKELLLIWSTYLQGKYAQCVARSDNGRIDGNFIHLDSLLTEDGGHGMIFRTSDGPVLAYHSPNQSLLERPVFKRFEWASDGNPKAF